MSWVAVVAVAAAVVAAPAQGDPELARGIKLVEQGEYAQAIIVLDAAARRLEAAGGKGKPEAAQARLHLGIAYVGEDQENLAISSFRRALEHNPAIDLSAFDVSPKVRELFEKVRNERVSRTITGPVEIRSKKGGSKAPILIVGLLGLAGGGARSHWEGAATAAEMGLGKDLVKSSFA